MMQRVAVLGVTGRLGRAVVRALGPERVLGLSRSAGLGELARHVRADRRDPSALAAVVDGADAVIDLCGFDSADGVALGRVARHVPVVFVSALAERHYPVWGDESALSATPLDPYGQGKREALAALQDAGCRVTSLRLPQLIALDDARPRELSYLTDCDRLGYAQIPGSGRQLPALAGVDEVAKIICQLLSLPSWPEGLQVAHPRPVALEPLVQALLRGAGRPTVVQPHPDRNWRGPHSTGDERVDTGRLRALLPDLEWPDLLDSYVRLGQVLAGSI